MAVHVRYKSLYIALPSSAKKKKKKNGLGPSPKHDGNDNEKVTKQKVQ